MSDRRSKGKMPDRRFEDKMLERQESYKQSTSTFFYLLPQGVRDRIYGHYFSAVTLSYPMRKKPGRNAFALRKTCWRARLEVGHGWMYHVLFEFATCIDMFDKLSNLPASTISNIRHMRVHDALHPNPPWVLEGHHLPHMLKQFPTLQLDRLTVLQKHRPRKCCETIELLLDEGNLKELHYIITGPAMIPSYQFSRHSSLALHAIPHEMHWIPSCHWKQILENRDGESTKPSVAVYVSTKSTLFEKVTTHCWGKKKKHESVQIEHVEKGYRLDSQHPVCFGNCNPTRLEGNDAEILIIAKRGSLVA
ncbi:hypothetical protein F5X98DRAFT_337630 [Xylaria grammica]|nr:hypothetical protein F5X98DRAFT_337630 [Xylaria grammica]